MSNAPQWSRRSLLAGALACGLCPRLVRAGGRRLLILGDSMIAGAFGLYLERDWRAAGFTAKRHGKSSSGLARPDFYDWPKAAGDDAESFRPDATVVMFGGNDVQGLHMGAGQWIRWQEPQWRAEYARRVGALADLLLAGGGKLGWIGMPVMRPPKFHKRVQRVNTIYRAEMAIRARADFFDIWELLADDKGRYTERLKLPGARKRVRVRAGDGIHLTRAGARYLADEVGPRILAQWGFAPPPAQDGTEDAPAATHELGPAPSPAATEPTG